MKMPKKCLDKAPLVNPEAAEKFTAEGKEPEIETSKTNTKSVSLKISEELFDRWQAASAKASITRSAYIKMALLEKLERDASR